MLRRSGYERSAEEALLLLGGPSTDAPHTRNEDAALRAEATADRRIERAVRERDAEARAVRDAIRVDVDARFRAMGPQGGAAAPALPGFVPIVGTPRVPFEVAAAAAAAAALGTAGSGEQAPTRATRRYGGGIPAGGSSAPTRAPSTQAFAVPQEPLPSPRQEQPHLQTPPPLALRQQPSPLAAAALDAAWAHTAASRTGSALAPPPTPPVRRHTPHGPPRGPSTAARLSVTPGAASGLSGASPAFSAATPVAVRTRSRGAPTAGSRNGNGGDVLGGGRDKSDRALACDAFAGWGGPDVARRDSFASLARWGEVCYNEAVVAVGGDAAVAAAGGRPIRLLASVCLMVVDHAMEGSAAFGGLWPRLRDEIFAAVFEGYERTASGPTTVAAAAETAAPPQQPYTAAMHRDRFARSSMHFEAAAESAAQLATARATMARTKSTIDKFVTLSDITALTNERRSIHRVFTAWRGMARTDARQRVAAAKYGERRRAALALQLRFLRWRRFALTARWRVASARLEETTRAAAAAAEAAAAAARDAAERSERGERDLRMALDEETELRVAIAEGHGVAVSEFQQILRGKDEHADAVEREKRRWERLAKSFRSFGGGDGTALAPPSLPLRTAGLALKAVEDELLGPSVGGGGGGSWVEGAPAVVRAREGLEGFLCTWVNAELGAAGVRGVEPIRNVHGDLRDGAVFRCLSRILRPGAASGRGGANFAGAAARSRADVDVFQSLVALMWGNAADGLHPPLLAHCPFYRSFFTAEEFLAQSHPTANAWILASLFVARAMRTAAAQAAQELAAAPGVKPTPGLLLGDAFRGKAQVAAAATGRRSIASSSGMMMAASARLPPMKPVVAAAAPGVGPSSPTAAAGSPRERRRRSEPSIFGLGSSEDFGRPEVSEAILSDVFNEDNEDGGDPSSPDAAAAAAAAGDAPSTSSRRDSNRFANTTSLRTFTLPVLSEELATMPLLSFVAALAAQNDVKEQWIGLARVVSSLLLRFRVLDVEQTSKWKKQQQKAAAEAAALAAVPVVAAARTSVAASDGSGPGTGVCSASQVDSGAATPLVMPPIWQVSTDLAAEQQPQSPNVPATPAALNPQDVARQASVSQASTVRRQSQRPPETHQPRQPLQQPPRSAAPRFVEQANTPRSLPPHQTPTEQQPSPQSGSASHLSTALLRSVSPSSAVPASPPSFRSKSDAPRKLPLSSRRPTDRPPSGSATDVMLMSRAPAKSLRPQ